jgi:NadR type nicotinamide-nucleotide adenylyltransferase
MITRIAVTGPESTGKSWLTEHLAIHFNTKFVSEYAREYIENLNRPYVFEDIEAIARHQLLLEENALANANGFLFIDTDFFVTKIWSDFVYHKCCPWILDQLQYHPYDLHLLCNIDLPWEYDPQREHPNQRKELFDIYQQELELSGRPFEIISGTGEARLESAINAISKHIYFPISE